MAELKCGDCDWVGRKNDVRPIEKAPHLFERVAPGEIMPQGECPECGAFCHASMTDDQIIRSYKIKCAYEKIHAALDNQPDTLDDETLSNIHTFLAEEYFRETGRKIRQSH